MEAFALEKYGEKQNTCNFLDPISERESITLYHLDATEDVSFRINIHGSVAADSSSDSIQTGSLLEGTLCLGRYGGSVCYQGRSLARLLMFVPDSTINLFPHR